MKEHLFLEFNGPLGLVPGEHAYLFHDELAHAQGIYLWAVPYHLGGYLPLYIGETSASVGRRIEDHLIKTVGGYNRICDPDLLLRGEPRVLWNGLWRRGTRGRFPEYLGLVEQLLPAIRRELQMEVVFVAPLKIESRLRRRVEGALAAHIKAQPAPASSIFPTDVRYYTRNASEAAVEVSVSCSSKIYGLPELLMA